MASVVGAGLKDAGRAHRGRSAAGASLLRVAVLVREEAFHRGSQRRCRFLRRLSGQRAAAHWHKPPPVLPLSPLLHEARSQAGRMGLAEVVAPDPPQTKGGDLVSADVEKVKPILYEVTYPTPLSAKFLARGILSAVIIFTLGWLYIGVAWNPNANVPRLRVAVLNCDSGVPPIVPTALVPAVLRQASLGQLLLGSSIYNATSPASGALRWEAYSCSYLAGQNVSMGCGSVAAACRDKLSSDIEQGRYWSAIYVPPEASLAYLSSFKAANMTRMQITFEHIINSGRSLSTYTYIRAAVNSVFGGVSLALGQMTLATAPVAVLDPTFLLQPVAVKLTDTHPVRLYGQHMATYIFCTLMWLGGAFCAGISRQFKTQAEMEAMRGKEVPLKDLILSLLGKMAASILFLFVQSVACVSILLCLGNWTEDDTHGNQWYFSPGYAIAYLWHLGFAFASISAVIMGVLGVEKSSFMVTLLLVVQLTTSAAFFAEELSNSFFHLGRALPFRYGVRALRTIQFGGMTEQMTMNWIVPFLWNVGSMGLLVVWYFKTYRKFDLVKSAPLESLQPLNAFSVVVGGF